MRLIFLRMILGELGLLFGTGDSEYPIVPVTFLLSHTHGTWSIQLIDPTHLVIESNIESYDDAVRIVTDAARRHRPSKVLCLDQAGDLKTLCEY